MKPVSLRASLVALAALALVGCTGSEETDTIVAIVVGSVLGILALTCFGGSWFMGCLVAGAINIRLNTTKPTAKSRGWGFAWGVLNGINGLLAAGLVVILFTAERAEPADYEGAIYLVIAAVLALVVAATTLVFAIRAEPGRVYEL